MYLLLLPLVAILVAVAYYYYTATHKFWNAQLQQFMPYSSLTEFFNMWGIGTKDHKAAVIHKLSQKYGPLYHNSFIPVMRTVTVTDVNLCKRIFLNPQRFPRATSNLTSRSPVIANFLGTNVVFTNGDVWAKQRGLMNPAFTNNAIFTRPFVEKCRECINEMMLCKNAFGEICVDAKNMMTRLTLDILGKTIFGMDFGNIKGQKSDLLDAYDYIFRYGLGNISILLVPSSYNLPTERNRKIKQCLQILDTEIYGYINQKRNVLQEIKTKLEKEHGIGQVTEDMIAEKMESKSLLDVMVLSNMFHSSDTNSAAMSDKELRDNTVALFVAGHETTATALSFALHTLGSKPQIQEKVYQEVIEKLANTKEEDYSYEDFMSLQYLNCFIKESLRCYPILPSLPARITSQEENFLGYTIPKDTSLIVNVIGLHFSPELWNEPMEFKPERFFEEKNIKTASWIPFGLGSHLCLGKNFSLLEQAVFLAMLLKDVEVYVKEPLQFDGTVLSTPSKFMLYMKPRNS